MENLFKMGLDDGLFYGSRMLRMDTKWKSQDNKKRPGDEFDAAINRLGHKLFLHEVIKTILKAPIPGSDTYRL